MRIRENTNDKANKVKVKIKNWDMQYLQRPKSLKHLIKILKLDK